MYMSTQRLHDPLRAVTDQVPASSAPSARRAWSTREAISLYVSGIFVETLGLALVAAYGWWAAGAIVAAAGVWIAAVGNRAWPAPERSVTAIGLVSGYLAARRHRHQEDGANNSRGQ
jgi:hypothetical protein